MAFGTASSNGADVVPKMNVTPLVDVVLVLLITFMVMTPLLTRTFWIHTPERRTKEVEKNLLQNDPSPPLVLRLDVTGTIRLNGAPVRLEELPSKLQRVFAAREDHIVFFDADDQAGYAAAVQVMDQAREGGAVTIGLLTEGFGG